MTAAELAKRADAFLRDEEQGSATLWNLFWLCGFGALLGLGLDTTAAMNMKGRLQMVADTASHAAAMDLFPIATDAIPTAVSYGSQNIPDHTDVVNSGDVLIGYYDLETRTFATDNVPNYNAVRVLATRDTSRDNALGTFFLRVVGLYDWDINAASTALYYSDMSQSDRCRKNGLFAGGTVEQTSNNTITGDYCMHGEGGVKINQNNIIHCGVEISLPDPSLWLTQAVATPSGTTVVCNENYEGLTNDEMVEQVVQYRSIFNNAEEEYHNVKDILDTWLTGSEPVNDPFNAIPPYIERAEYTDVTKFNSDAKTGKLVAGTMYVVQCDSNTRLQPEGLLRNIGIYTNCIIDVRKDKNVSAVKPQKTAQGYDKTNLCDPDASTCNTVPWEAEITPLMTCAEAIAAGYESYQTLLDTVTGETYRDGETPDTTAELCAIEPGANGLWDNVFLFTTAFEGGDVSQKAITFPNNMQIGRLDGCAEGGGARIYAAGSIATPSGTVIHGSHFVLLGSADLAAKADGTYGLTVEAAENITYSAQGKVGGCLADEDDLASDVVVTVRPIAIVQ
jgi:hypothetical protein